MSCSRTQHSKPGEAQTCGPSVSSQALYHCAPCFLCAGSSFPMLIILTVVKTPEAVLQERQGIRDNGLGQFVAASEAI